MAGDAGTRRVRARFRSRESRDGIGRTLDLLAVRRPAEALLPTYACGETILGGSNGAVFAGRKKLGLSLLLRSTKPEFWVIPYPNGTPVEILNRFHPGPFISGQIQFSWMPDN